MKMHNKITTQNQTEEVVLFNKPPFGFIKHGEHATRDDEASEM